MNRHMSIPERAKQFMAFSALKGFEEAVAEKEIIKYERIILGEDAQQELDEKLRALRVGDEIKIVYYEAYAYRELSGRLHKIDPINKSLLIDGKEININDITDVK